jgi:hypothetical protein
MGIKEFTLWCSLGAFSLCNSPPSHHFLKVILFYQAALEANGTLSRREAYALASVNLERLLGIKATNTDLVAVKHGDLLGFEGEVISIISAQRETVDFMQ